MISQPYLFHYPVTHHHVQKIYRYSSHLFNHAMDITLWCNIWILQIPYDDSCRCHHSSILGHLSSSSNFEVMLIRCPLPISPIFQLLFIIFNGCEWFECQAKFVISFFQSCSSWIMIQVSTNLLFGCVSSICHE